MWELRTGQEFRERSQTDRRRRKTLSLPSNTSPPYEIHPLSHVNAVSYVIWQDVILPTGVSNQITPRITTDDKLVLGSQGTFWDIKE